MSNVRGDEAALPTFDRQKTLLRRFSGPALALPRCELRCRACGREAISALSPVEIADVIEVERSHLKAAPAASTSNPSWRSSTRAWLTGWRETRVAPGLSESPPHPAAGCHRRWLPPALVDLFDEGGTLGRGAARAILLHSELVCMSWKTGGKLFATCGFWFQWAEGSRSRDGHSGVPLTISEGAKALTWSRLCCSAGFRQQVNLSAPRSTAGPRGSRAGA